MDKETRLFVCLSVVSVRGVHPVGNEAQMLHRNLRGGEKILGSSDQYTKFESVVNQKNHQNYCHYMSHFNAKMH